MLFLPRTPALLARAAYVGKYLNAYNGSYVPPGWDEWVGLVRNSRYYNYTLNVNGRRERHGDDYASDYLPDLICNRSRELIRRFAALAPQRGSLEAGRPPFLLVMSFPAPHGPEDSAPQFQQLFANVTSHRSVRSSDLFLAHDCVIPW